MTDEPVRVNSARRRRLEAALLAGAPWPLAVEAAATVGLDRDAREQTYTLDDPRPQE